MFYICNTEMKIDAVQGDINTTDNTTEQRVEVESRVNQTRVEQRAEWSLVFLDIDIDVVMEKEDGRRMMGEG